MRDGLRDLYSVIKGQDANIHFAFLTGVSKFSKVSLFSGLNNLRDITVSQDYSAICGYTEADLGQTFAPELVRLDRDEVRLVQRLQLDRGGGLQPLRSIAAVPRSQLPPLVVRDRHADLLGRLPA